MGHRSSTTRAADGRNGPRRPASSVDVAVVGAGIVGLAAARALRRIDPAGRIVVIDKAPGVACHQSGHNSGVLHSGIYYPPDSEKSRLCLGGKIEMEAYCKARDIPFETCGKVIVATTSGELAGLETLWQRGRANGVESVLIDRAHLRELEPHADGLAALHIPLTGVIDFAAVSRVIASELSDDGVHLALGTLVTSIDERPDRVVVSTTEGTIRAHRLVNCAGLHSDRIARLAGVDTSVRIVPFRGEYHELVASRRHLVRHLVYPVPDPRFPFLGVHFTRGLDGRVHVGPNAVPALAREGYLRRTVAPADVVDLATDPAVWRLVRRYGPAGIGEMVRAISHRSFVRALQRLVPDIGHADVVRAGAGVRAQAVADDGTLVDDFVLVRTRRSVHVLNAPSPAATASLAIGREIATAMRTG